jgi:hypothetical protein
MPKSPDRHKTKSGHNRVFPDRSRRAKSLADLLIDRHSVVAEVARQRSAESEWRVTLSKLLPESLRNKVNRLVEKDGQLFVFTESSGYAARLKFALAELENELKQALPRVTKIHVRVRPIAADAEGQKDA